MTKPKEPSTAILTVWNDAIVSYKKTSDDVESARIIQRHVDREVRKVLKENAEIVRCAEIYVESEINQRDWSEMSNSLFSLISAVRAKQKGKLK